MKISLHDAIVAKIDQDQFSGVLYVTSKGKPLLKFAAGFADRERGIPNKIDTKFNVGSNSKMFTAIAIAQLAQKGLLHFIDPIGKYLQDYSNPDVRNAALTNLVTTGKVETPDGQKYAYGFRDRTENGVRWFGHSGGGSGANTTLRIYPESGYVIIVLSNMDFPAADQLAEYVSKTVQFPNHRSL
jgi:CubicO group peptidase (beta-lactamase class C family)